MEKKNLELNAPVNDSNQPPIPGMYWQPSMFEEQRILDIQKSREEVRSKVVAGAIDRALATEMFTIPK